MTTIVAAGSRSGLPLVTRPAYGGADAMSLLPR